MNFRIKEALQFDDVLLEPQFSNIKSRKDVDTSSSVGGLVLRVPVMSSPMDTITTPALANALYSNGAIGALHRFQHIQDNQKQFMEVEEAIVSVGLGDWERLEALHSIGADKFLLDVAHGAQQSVVEFINQFRRKYKNEWLMVGNFATDHQILELNLRLEKQFAVDAYRVGIGSGAACTTRVKTGHGLPLLESVISCSKTGLNIVADGGVRNSGDMAKALAAGAKAVMAGRIFAGTTETASNVYRGSASVDSYKIQNKDWACAEGESYAVPSKGPVKGVLDELEAGLRSAMTYSGASTIDEFQKKALFVKVTTNGSSESKAHGRHYV